MSDKKKNLKFEDIDISNSVIVIESPNKAKSFLKYTGIKTIATAGHFRDLPKNELGVDLRTYDGKYVLTADKGKRVSQNLINSCRGKTVFIAADADREGDAIGYFVYNEVKKVAKATYRTYVPNGIIKEGPIKQGLEESVPFIEIDQNLYFSFFARRQGDRLVGYLLSPIATRELKHSINAAKVVFSVGRVQTVAVRIIKDREDEIKKFKPQPFWKIKGTFETPETKGKKVIATHDNKNTNARFDAIEDANTLMDALKNKKGIIQSLSSKKSQQNPPPPFILSTLIEDAGNKLGFSPKDTTDVAQSLKDDGYITYHRTDSTFVSPDFIEETREFLTDNLGIDFVPRQARKFASKNSQAEAHEAIRPSSIEDTGESIKDPKQFKLYELIRNKMLASQMSPAIISNVTLSISVELENSKKEIFTVKSKSILENGYYEVTPPSSNSKEVFIPKLEKGDELFLDFELDKSSTKAPARYTDVSLIKEMEKRGIGRPSTYAPTVTNILNKGYIKSFQDGSKKAKSLKCLEKGSILIDFVLKDERMAWVANYNMTKDMEKTLDDISEGKVNYKEFLKEIHEKMGFMTLEDTRPPKVYLPDEFQCPICNSKLLEEDSKYKCEEYLYDPKTKASSKCQFVLWKDSQALEKPISQEELRTLLDNKPLTGKNKANYTLSENLINDCINNPDLKQKKSFLSVRKNYTDITCPLCNEGKLHETAKQFVCDKAVWSKKGNDLVNTGCQFKVNKNNTYLELTINQEILKDFCDNKTVITPNNKKAILNLENEWYIEEIRDPNAKPKYEKKLSDIECPKCKKHKLEITKLTYKCSGGTQKKVNGKWKTTGCDFQVWINDRPEADILIDVNNYGK